ncbi:unnamed protein product [Ectocarpus sp. 6 AP-2014]
MYGAVKISTSLARSNMSGWGRSPVKKMVGSGDERAVRHTVMTEAVAVCFTHHNIYDAEDDDEQNNRKNNVARACAQIFAHEGGSKALVWLATDTSSPLLLSGSFVSSTHKFGIQQQELQ